MPAALRDHDLDGRRSQPLEVGRVVGDDATTARPLGAADVQGVVIHRRAMAQAVHKAMSSEPSIDWLLENRDKVTHEYYQRALDAKKAKN